MRKNTSKLKIFNICPRNLTILCTSLKDWYFKIKITKNVDLFICTAKYKPVSELFIKMESYVTLSLCAAVSTLASIARY